MCLIKNMKHIDPKDFLTWKKEGNPQCCDLNTYLATYLNHIHILIF